MMGLRRVFVHRPVMFLDVLRRQFGELGARTTQASIPEHRSLAPWRPRFSPQEIRKSGECSYLLRDTGRSGGALRSKSTLGCPVENCSPRILKSMSGVNAIISQDFILLANAQADQLHVT